MIFDEASSVATSLEKTERTVDVRGIATHMFEAGSPDAPPLLYLHGTNLGNLWLAFHTTLAQQFHVFAHPSSRLPPEPPRYRIALPRMQRRHARVWQPTRDLS